MTIITGIDESKILSNLGTYTHTALSSSIYKISITVTELPPSGISVVIQHNGSTVATAASPAASQSHIELQTLQNCTSGDTLSVILSSSTPTDQGPQAFKGLLAISIIGVA